jgi:hypothetical protein
MTLFTTGHHDPALFDTGITAQLSSLLSITTQLSSLLESWPSSLYNLASLFRSPHYLRSRNIFTTWYHKPTLFTTWHRNQGFATAWYCDSLVSGPPGPQSEKSVPKIPLTSIVVIGLWKLYAKMKSRCVLYCMIFIDLGDGCWWVTSTGSECLEYISSIIITNNNQTVIKQYQTVLSTTGINQQIKQLKRIWEWSNMIIIEMNHEANTQQIHNIQYMWIVLKRLSVGGGLMHKAKRDCPNQVYSEQMVLGTVR